MLAGFFLLLSSSLVLFAFYAAWKQDATAEILFAGGALAITLTALLSRVGFQYYPAPIIFHIQYAELAVTIILIAHAFVINRKPHL